MRVVYAVILFLLNVLYVEVSNSSAVTYASTGKESEERCDEDCSFCPAYYGDWYQFKCTRNNVKLSVGYCMTVDDNQALFVTKCPYFQLEGHNVSDPRNFKLPDNISELNDYMCGPMNRKGFLCEECIDGFAVSFTSMGHKCSNCTDVWYGIPLYLLIELAPITVFYPNLSSAHNLCSHNVPHPLLQFCAIFASRWSISPSRKDHTTVWTQRTFQDQCLLLQLVESRLSSLCYTSILYQQKLQAPACGIPRLCIGPLPSLLDRSDLGLHQVTRWELPTFCVAMETIS